MKAVTNRKIDELGRIVLPAEIRLKLNLNYGDSLKIFLDRGKIILKKNETPFCFIKRFKNKTAYQKAPQIFLRGLFSKICKI